MTIQHRRITAILRDLAFIDASKYLTETQKEKAKQPLLQEIQAIEQQGDLPLAPPAPPATMGEPSGHDPHTPGRPRSAKT